MNRVLLLAITIALVSCGSLRPGIVRSYDLEFSDSVTFDKDHKLTFNEVLEDSRCPVDVQCITAGQALLEFEAARNGDDIITFNLGFSADISVNRDTILYDEYRIELLEVLPMPEEGFQPKAESYKIRVVVEKIP